jgi:4-alpha-glucanotransferase
LWTGSDLREQEAVGVEPNVSGMVALRARLRELTGLPDGAPSAAVALAIHRRLAEAPSVLVTATLEDALGVAERPNLPGTTIRRRPNWSLALPETIEEIEDDPRPKALAAILERSPAAPSDPKPAS